MTRGGLRRPFKFVLLKGPEHEGYVRFGYRGDHHTDILGHFYGEAAKTGQTREDYQPRGGGYVEIDGLDEMISEYKSDFDKLKPDIFTLSFYGASDDLGAFDKELLETTFSQHLSSRFAHRLG